MAAPTLDPNVLAHLEWLGFVQPTGLVVSAPALVRAGAILERRDAEGQKLLRECAELRQFPPEKEPLPFLPDFRRFAEQVLGWTFSPKGYAGTPESPIPPELEVRLPNEEEVLRPDIAVRELSPAEGRPAWQLLVQVVEPGQELGRTVARPGGLEASPHGRLERLLRQTRVAAGLLFNGRTIRLLSAPHGESSGWLDFQVAEMVQTAGRPISTALRLLLNEQRLLSQPKRERLAALLEESRKYQNEVSERLAEQVLHALYELLRGFQAAHDASKGKLLRDLQREHPDLIYRGLLTVLLRLVFLLYAEERDMLPDDEVFEQHYSLAGLYERLREDAALYPDTMDQRFGAWAQLLVLFRMVHDGAAAGALKLPRRHGVLFDPDQYKFLEGRPEGGARQKGERLEAPLVSDGTIYRALENLLVLDGERISYRALDVEEIGSVYQTMMGFKLERAFGRSVAIKSAKKFGAPVTVDLDALLAESGGKREKRLQERLDRKLSESVKKAVAAAGSIEELHAALLPVVDREATPDLVPPEGMVLQPSEERRRSGSHYTPRSLTEPIVRTTLEPILARLKGPEGQPPRPEQILDLKVCDPAMGSGAFLVEACRQLGEALIESWRAHGGRPEIPQDEDEVLFARRLVAQRCLYGVDRNPVAVDLAKVSLWLATLAKDHAFTFLDHALRHGDSLVGLSRKQIEAFHWDASQPQISTVTAMVRPHLERITGLRRQIREAADGVDESELRRLWDDARHELDTIRLLGDLAVLAFFEGETPKERAAKREEYAAEALSGSASAYCAELEEHRYSDPPLVPFHWEIEFPEVFEREKPGFAAVVGNPPYQSGKRLVESQGSGYTAWLLDSIPAASASADLAAHFLRKAFHLVRDQGALGLVTTEALYRSESAKQSGLEVILKQGATIYSARRRLRWPGSAAVVVCTVSIIKGRTSECASLDGKRVDRISAFLLNGTADASPAQLSANASRCFQGSNVLGLGFLFDDTDTTGRAGKVAEARRLLESNPKNAEVLRPFIGGDFVKSPSLAAPRYVISFGERKESEAREWADLFEILERRVKPERTGKDGEKYPRMVYEWWKFWNYRAELYERLARADSALIVNRKASAQFSVTRVDSDAVFSDSLAVVPGGSFALFAVMQSRVHEEWVRFVGNMRGESLSYPPSRCFETFPFPERFEEDTNLAVVGGQYFSLRASLMESLGLGLTDIYNRFHDPAVSDHRTEALRTLHAAMDRAVLDAYGWKDLGDSCEFISELVLAEDDTENEAPVCRFRWPDEVRDEVLARLLDLNAQRAAEEARNGPAAKAGGGRTKGGKRAAKADTGTGEERDLFS